MKLHLPKILLAALYAAATLGHASTVDSSSIGWDSASPVWKWNGSAWVRGTLESGSSVTDWENGYTWADNTSNIARIANKGPILLVDGTTEFNISNGSVNTSDGGGLVAINGASGTVGLGIWGGYVYVEEGCEVTATLASVMQLKNMSANSSGYSVVAGGTLIFGNNLTFDNGGVGHKWFVGENGSVTINGNFNRNGKALAVDVEAGAIVEPGTALANRESRTRSVITATSATAGNDLSEATVRVLDVTGAEMQLENIVTKTSTGISITDYARATLVWKNEEGATWTNTGTGWYKEGDADGTDTSFIHGDYVVFEAGSTASLGGDVTFDTMTVRGDTSVDLGSHVMTGNGINVTGGALTLSNPKNASGNAGNMQVKSWETGGEASVSYTGNYRLYNGEVTFNADMTISGSLAVVGNSTVNVTGGNLTVGNIRLHDYNGNYAEQMFISGGVVNVTSTHKGVDNNAGILLGHFPNNNNSRYLSLSGGVLNATETSTLVGWDSKAQLLISGGEANLYLLGINYSSVRQYGSSATLSEGRLNIGAGGIVSQNASTLTVSGGTIGTLTTDAWTLDSHITLNTSGDFTIDTEKRAASTTGASAASGEAGSITISGALTGSGNLDKIGIGTLTLNHANSGYSGHITVSGGSLKLADAAALGTGALTVEIGGTLVVGAGITTSLNTNSIAGTLALEAGSRLDLAAIAGETDTHSLSIGTLDLAGNATIGMSIDQTLFTSFSVGTLTDNGNTLTLDFSKPLSPFEEAKTQVVASGLSGVGLNLAFGGEVLAKAEGSDTWSAMLGRTSYTWTLDSQGSLTYSETASQRMDLVWNGGSSGTWGQGAEGWQTTVQDTAQPVVFENDDNVAFAGGDASLTVDGTIIVNDMRLEDGATVSLGVAAGDTASSLSAATLTLGSTGAPGEGTVSMTVDGLAATAGNLTVEAGKTASVTLREGATLTVNDKLSTAEGAGLTIDGGIHVGTIEAAADSAISITGDVTGASEMSLTAGENATITLSGASISAGTGGVTINGNVTIGDTVDTSTFTHGGDLTIESGTTTIKAYRDVRAASVKVTVAAGATLDVSEGRLWHGGNYVGNGTMEINGTYITKVLAYGDATNTGYFHNNADSFKLGNGAEIIVTGGSGDDAQGMLLNGSDAANTYTLTFEGGAESTMKFGGGLKVAEGTSRTHDLVFNVKPDGVVTLAYTLGDSMSSTWDRLTSLTKRGGGDMAIVAQLGNFNGTVDVQAGTMKIGKGQGAEGALELPNLKLSGGTTQITNNTTLSKITGCAKTGEGDNAAYAALSVDSGVTLTTAAFENAEYVLNGLSGEGKLEYTGAGKLTLGMSRELKTINGVFSATGAALEFNNLRGNSDAMKIAGKVSTTGDVEVVSNAALEVEENGTLKSGGTLVIGHAENPNTNKGTLTAAGTVKAEGGVTFRGTESKLNVKSDNVTIGKSGSLTHFEATGDDAIGNVVIDGGKTLKVQDSLISHIRFSKSETGEGHGVVDIAAGSLLSATVGVVDTPDSGAGDLDALMTDCKLKNTDVVISGSGAIDAKVIGVDDFSSKVFAFNIMKGVTIEAGSSFALTLKGMENYRDVVLHWSVTADNTTNGIALMSEGGENTTIDLDAGTLTQVDYTGAPIVFSTQNGVVVDVWATCSVPEPATGTLSVLALAALATRRRRRK